MTNFVINIGIKEMFGIIFTLIGSVITITWFLSSIFGKIDGEFRVINIKIENLGNRVGGLELKVDRLISK